MDGRMVAATDCVTPVLCRPAPKSKTRVLGGKIRVLDAQNRFLGGIIRSLDCTHRALDGEARVLGRCKVAIRNAASPAVTGVKKSYKGVKVGFQGEPGAYSEIACQRAFPDCEPCPCPTFDAAFQALQKGDVTRALLPMENSTGGTVHDVYLLLPKYGLHIVGEYSLGVEHCLLTVPGTKLEDIRKVQSHWQALAQCTQFCEKNGFQMEEHEDTAGAAAEVAREKFTDVAAIASSRAADIYDLEILEKGIQNNDLNYTRFVGLSNQEIPPPSNTDASHCKTTIMFACRDGAGGLQLLLAKLLALNINLEKIEPQAMVNDPLIDKASGRKFNYLFVADFAGSTADPVFDDAFALFEEHAVFYRVVGSYVRHVF